MAKRKFTMDDFEEQSWNIIDRMLRKTNGQPAQAGPMAQGQQQQGAERLGSRLVKAASGLNIPAPKIPKPRI